MKRIKTYVINLVKDQDRKVYMEELLSPYPYLDVEFIEAVYGKELDSTEIPIVFDSEKAYKRYGRYCDLGEIGCTLSHRKIYKKIVEQEIDYALILEDDISIKGYLKNVLFPLDEYMKQKQTKIVLLSGGYTYWMKKEYNGIKLAKVYDANYTHSYLINNYAAQVLLEEKVPCIFADDWIYISKKNILIEAIYPHIIDQNRDGRFISNVWEDTHRIYKNNLSSARLLTYIKNRIISKILCRMGRRE